MVLFLVGFSWESWEVDYLLIFKMGLVKKEAWWSSREPPHSLAKQEGTWITWQSDIQLIRAHGSTGLSRSDIPIAASRRFIIHHVEAVQSNLFHIQEWWYDLWFGAWGKSEAQGRAQWGGNILHKAWTYTNTWVCPSFSTLLFLFYGDGSNLEVLGPWFTSSAEENSKIFFHFLWGW